MEFIALEEVPVLKLDNAHEFGLDEGELLILAKISREC